MNRLTPEHELAAAHARMITRRHFLSRCNSGLGAIALAQAAAGVDPNTISYVEAHGTATPLGDPIEVAALTKGFGESSTRKGFCALGSLKTNIGHLDAAAGVAGLIKTVLALKHAQIPPSLHFETPNPEIDFDASPFRVNAELRPWETGAGVQLRDAPGVRRDPRRSVHARHCRRARHRVASGSAACRR